MKQERGLDRLNENFRKKVELFLEEVGDEIFITESYRSQERQNELYEQGRTKPGRKVTWTRNSNHTKGLAIDIAFKGNDLYPKDNKRWKAIYKTAKKYGITNIYERTGKDKPHLECDGTVKQYEHLFKLGTNQGNSKVLGNIENWIKQTNIDRELAFSLLIMFNRVK